MSVSTLPIREEYFDNDPTGVEVEDLEPSDSIVRPWDPASIRVSTKSFSLRQVLDQIHDNDIELAPDFQRNKVWKSEQKSRLIESVLLQIPLPAFYFAEDSDGRFRVVDGLQRLSTVYDYVHTDASPSFPRLTGLEYLKEADGRTFDELPLPWRRRINNTQIVVHVIDPTTPPEVKYDIFRRINTGGSPLNSQEIRHCMSKQRSRDFLKRCAATKEFNLATGGALRNHVRMEDREMVLRFCAFRLLGIDSYATIANGALDVFLERATDHLDDPALASDPELERLFEEFRTAMSNAYHVFGDHTFRKWPLGSDRRNPVNRPLFETWSMALADHTLADLADRRDAIVRAARTLMATDTEYITAITSSTGGIGRVRCRFDRAFRAAGAGR